MYFPKHYRKLLDKTRQAKRFAYKKLDKVVVFEDWSDALSSSPSKHKREGSLPRQETKAGPTEVYRMPSQASKRRKNRSYSDGNLSSHLKTFSELRYLISLAKNTCNHDLGLLMDEMSSFTESYLQSLTESDSDFVRALTDLSGICTEIIGLNILDLLKPSYCAKYIQRIQEFQNLWNLNPVWKGQMFPVRILIIFSNVSRLVESLHDDSLVLKHIFEEKTDSKSIYPLAKSTSVPNKPISGHNSNFHLSQSETEEDASIFLSDTEQTSGYRDKRKTSFPASSTNRSRASPLSSPSLFSPRRDPTDLGPLSSPIKALPANAMSEIIDSISSRNIIIETNRDNRVTYVSPSILSVLGYEVSSILDTSEIPFLLLAVDHNATIVYKLEKNKEIELFEMQVRNSQIFKEATTVFSMPSHIKNINIYFKARKNGGDVIEMEGQGVPLQLNFEKSQSVCWVIRPRIHSLPPLSPAERPMDPGTNILKLEEEPKDIDNKSTSSSEENANDFALCHICERTVPIMQFEEHSELCVEIHHIEADLAQCNDVLKAMEEELKYKLQIVEEEALANMNDTRLSVHLLTVRDLVLVKLTELSDIISLKVNDTKLDFSICTTKRDGNMDLLRKRLKLFTVPAEETFVIDEKPIFDQQSLDADTICGLGLGIYSLLCDVQSQIRLKDELLTKCEETAERYNSCLVREEDAKVRIGIETGTLLETSDQVKELEDIFSSLHEFGGLIINTESNSGAASLDSLSLASPEKAKPSSSNRVSIAGGNTRRPSTMRPPRMVFSSDRAFDIEMIHSPIMGSPKSTMESSFSQEFEPRNPSPGKALGSSTSLSIPFSKGAPSIHDFQIVKPISKGAFGSVYLAKKILTSEYYAIKVLKKSDMISKNQVTNIKAERSILTQIDSPFVVKMFFSFQSKNNLYLVMEYLNGGDCAALIKAIGQLDEKWTRQYIAEITLGLEFLHARGIIHRYHLSLFFHSDLLK